MFFRVPTTKFGGKKLKIFSCEFRMEHLDLEVEQFFSWCEHLIILIVWSIFFHLVLPKLSSLLAHPGKDFGVF